MNLIEIFSILGIHWFADFIMQTDKQAKDKSKNWYALLAHTLTYSFVWFIMFGIICILNPLNWKTYQILNLIFLFPLITFFIHTITDYITSRENSKLWEQGKIHNFFICVGFDQYLHYIQLFLTYWILIN